MAQAAEVLRVLRVTAGRGAVHVVGTALRVATAATACIWLDSGSWPHRRDRSARECDGSQQGSVSRQQCCHARIMCCEPSHVCTVKASGTLYFVQNLVSSLGHCRPLSSFLGWVVLSTHAMCGVWENARVLAVLVVIMGLIQREMVATSWTMITIDAVEHSRAVQAGGQGGSASWSSAQPIRVAGLRTPWPRPSTNLKPLLTTNESWASGGCSGANGSGIDAGGHWMTSQRCAGQAVWTIWARPSRARPPAKPKALLDANEQRDPRVGSDTNGGGRNGKESST